MQTEPGHRVNMNPLDHTCLPAVLGLPLFLPLAGARVPAGFPSPADNHLDEGIDLSRHFVRHPTSTFVVRVAGESLIGIGIRPGDYLVVDRSRDPGEGDVVLAVVDGDFTAKCYRTIGGRTTLAAENPTCPSIVWREGCEIWGVVTSVHRDLLSASG